MQVYKTRQIFETPGGGARREFPIGSDRWLIANGSVINYPLSEATDRYSVEEDELLLGTIHVTIRGETILFARGRDFSSAPRVRRPESSLVRVCTRTRPPSQGEGNMLLLPQLNQKCVVTIFHPQIWPQNKIAHRFSFAMEQMSQSTTHKSSAVKPDLCSLISEVEETTIKPRFSAR